MSDTILEGDVGPELANYVNALLDRIRELEDGRDQLLMEHRQLIEWAVSKGYLKSSAQQTEPHTEIDSVIP